MVTNELNDQENSLNLILSKFKDLNGKIFKINKNFTYQYDDFLKIHKIQEILNST